MDCDLGVTDLRAEWLEHSAASIRIVTPYGVRLCFGGGGYDRETGDGTPMTIGPRFGKLAGGHPLLPDAWLEMVVVTHRVRQLWLKIF